MRQKLQIALRGDVGLRTVDAYFQGRSQEATTRSRIERTLRELAMESFIRPPPAQAA